jgi:hypothetical protein
VDVAAFPKAGMRKSTIIRFYNQRQKNNSGVESNLVVILFWLN